jgi:hypothetical protein
MNATSVNFRKHHCFKTSWAGFDDIRPVNIIIGRNNSGKSRLLDLVEALCLDNVHKQPWEIGFKVSFDEEALRRGFAQNVSEGNLPGNHWANHGRFFVGLNATVEMRQGAVTAMQFDPPDALKSAMPVNRNFEMAVAAREETLRRIVQLAILPLKAKVFRRLSAERNIGMELASPNLALGTDGHGATNIIRRYLTSSTLPRELIQRDLLSALNEVFGADGRFTEIEARLHDQPPEPDQSKDHWEIFFAEQKKGLIALSRSGSGLKTVLLVLLNLIVVPVFEGKAPSSYVFAFEELETHLHPTLLRRLLLFIETFAKEKKATVFLTTHSSVALDLFGLSTEAQIIHVQHDGESATTQAVRAHFDRVGIVAELGAKPSDLLHANGIIWVEGPSDRIYVNRWIEILSNGKLKEGRDYTCAMYGGALLARAQLVAPDNGDPELSNLLNINSNVIVLCDSDRTADQGAGAELKGRVVRIRNEIAAIPRGVIWITAAKEIENYLPADALQKVYADRAPRAPDQYECFFPSREGVSFIETQLGRKSIDKTELATLVVPHLTEENMAGRFDWKVEGVKMIETIRGWNR